MDGRAHSRGHALAGTRCQLGQGGRLRYDTDVASGDVFYTDSNGRETVKRVRDRRGPSYPAPYKISEPVAGNYYPINALASINDDCVEFDVMLTRHWAAHRSVRDRFEFMVHRRLQGRRQPGRAGTVK